MIYYKTQAEIELIRQSCAIVEMALTEAAKLLKPGVTTKQLDIKLEQLILDNKAVPSFKDYRGYPFTSCISVNEAVVHGFPSDKELKEGDIISVDVGAYKNGYHGDSAYTFALGDPGEKILQLMRVTKESLYKGIEKAIAGNRIGDIFRCAGSRRKKTWLWNSSGVGRTWTGQALARRSASGELWQTRNRC